MAGCRGTLETLCGGDFPEVSRSNRQAHLIMQGLPWGLGHPTLYTRECYGLVSKTS